MRALRRQLGCGQGPDDEDRAGSLMADAFADAAERTEAVQAPAADDQKVGLG